MELVVDANILFSLLIASKHSKQADFFFSEELKLYAPERILVECKEHLSEISKKAGLGEKDIELLITLFSAHVELLSFAEFSAYLPEAKKVSPDPADVEYLAVALKLRCALWSQDKQLKSQSVIKVLSTSELLKLLS